MSTEQTWQTVSTSSDATMELAEAIGNKLVGGEFIELVSDLGGGKTTFVGGLAKGVGSSDNVHSPSFTLANQYQGKKLTIYHMDLYRLDETGIMADELREFIETPDGVVVVEWPGLIENLIPSKRLKIEIKVTGENTRQLNFYYPAELKYILDL